VPADTGAPSTAVKALETFAKIDVAILLPALPFVVALLQVSDASPTHLAKANQPPKDAADPKGAKAPGKPGTKDGFVEPKSGTTWGKVEKGKSAGKSGWVHKGGKVWVPTGPEGSPNAHGGPHWDVQNPDGSGHVNVYPEQ
jgi:hypothetical protein